MRLNKKQKEQIKEDTKRLLRGESCDNCYYGLLHPQCYLDANNPTLVSPRNICEKYISVQKKLLGDLKSEEDYKNEVNQKAKGTYKEAVEKSGL